MYWKSKTKWCPIFCKLIINSALLIIGVFLYCHNSNNKATYSTDLIASWSMWDSESVLYPVSLIPIVDRTLLSSRSVEWINYVRKLRIRYANGFTECFIDDTINYRIDGTICWSKKVRSKSSLRIPIWGLFEEKEGERKDDDNNGITFFLFDWWNQRLMSSWLCNKVITLIVGRFFKYDKVHVSKE